MSLRVYSNVRQTVEPCSFDHFLDALDNPAPVFADPSRTVWFGMDVEPLIAADVASAGERPASGMMAPANSPFWIGVVRSMRARQDRIGIACLLVAITMFVMIVGRLAWAYAAGLL